MFLKFIMACTVVIACFLCGRSLTASMTRRVRLIREQIAALKLLQIRMADQLEPLSIALEDSGSTLFESVGEFLSDQCGPFSAWCKAVRKVCIRGGEADCLRPQEKKILDELFRTIGNSGAAQQDLALRSCIAQLEDIAQHAEDRMAEATKLYGSLGVLLGLSIAVLLM